MVPENIGRFLKDFSEWASQRPDIQAVALVGSYARGTARPDSDVDLVIICGAPASYLSNQSWAQRFGPIDREQVEDYGKLSSLRVWYCNGLEVEYGLTDEGWAALPLDEGTRTVIVGGISLLFERGNILSRHLAARNAGN